MHDSLEEPDLGTADPAVMAALAGYRDRTIGAASVLAALAKSRLLVPVVAVLDKAETTAGGARVEKSSHMATVSTTGRDGRRGLLAFTSLESLPAGAATGPGCSGCRTRRGCGRGRRGSGRAGSVRHREP